MVSFSAPIDNKKIALLHVAKRDLRLSDEDYRAILSRHAGVESAASLNLSGFLSVVSHLGQLGWRSSWLKRTYGDRRDMASPAQVDFIRKLWRDYRGEDDAGDQALNAWLTRFHHISALRFVTAEIAAKIIPGLKAMVRRQQDRR